jgi:hypothetical protein
LDYSLEVCDHRSWTEVTISLLDESSFRTAVLGGDIFGHCNAPSPPDIVDGSLFVAIFPADRPEQ